MIGCACDADGSWTISWDEANSEECVAVQYWIAGQNMDQETFDYVDADQDGQICGDEAADALEGLWDLPSH